MSKLPITSLGGIAATLTFCFSATLAIASYPGGFSPFDMWLGDYGFPNKNPAGAGYYNMGAMLTGLLLIVFYAGFTQHGTSNATRTVLRTAGQLSGVVSGISLFVSGYLTPAVMPENMIASILFFVLTGLSIVLLHLAFSSSACYSEAAACMGIASIALILLLAVASFIISIEPIVAEWCTILAISAWVGLMSRDAYHISRGTCKAT